MLNSIILNSKIQFSSSLYIICNEKSYVVGWKIVPDDTREHIIELLSTIYNRPGDHIIPQAFFTDDYDADFNLINTAFGKLYPDEKVPQVMQDIWHLEQRTIKLLAKAHPDYKMACKELRIIFNKVQSDNPYTEPAEFIEALLGWAEKFSEPQITITDTTKKMQLLAGKIYDDKI